MNLSANHLHEIVLVFVADPQFLLLAIIILVSTAIIDICLERTSEAN